MPRVAATFNREKILWNKNKKFIVGIDEVGRGAWAGPLVAAAVIFPTNYRPKYKYFDSKLLNSNEREELSEIIQREAVCTAIGVVEVETIIDQGLTAANQLAFTRALESLSTKADHYLIDAFKLKDVSPEDQTPIIKGDYYSGSIAAASIVAKVFRDNVMRRLPKVYKHYKFAFNKGYGTVAHQEAILKYGLSDLHRTSYNLQILQ